MAEQTPKPFFAHSANEAGQWHDLADHLRSVAKLAGEFASKFDASWEQEIEQ